MSLDNFAHNRQACARASPVLLAPVQPPEDAEDSLVMLRRNANAVVPDIEDRLLCCALV
jgi:hypothetical protein